MPSLSQQVLVGAGTLIEASYHESSPGVDGAILNVVSLTSSRALRHYALVSASGVQPDATGVTERPPADSRDAEAFAKATWMLVCNDSRIGLVEHWPADTCATNVNGLFLVGLHQDRVYRLRLPAKHSFSELPMITLPKSCLLAGECGGGTARLSSQKPIVFFSWLVYLYPRSRRVCCSRQRNVVLVRRRRRVPLGLDFAARILRPGPSAFGPARTRGCSSVRIGDVGHSTCTPP